MRWLPMIDDISFVVGFIYLEIPFCRYWKTIRQKKKIEMIVRTHAA